MAQPKGLKARGPRTRWEEDGRRGLIKRTVSLPRTAAALPVRRHSHEPFRSCTLTGADPPRFAVLSAALLDPERTHRLGWRGTSRRKDKTTADFRVGGYPCGEGLMSGQRGTVGQPASEGSWVECQRRATGLMSALLTSRPRVLRLLLWRDESNEPRIATSFARLPGLGSRGDATLNSIIEHACSPEDDHPSTLAVKRLHPKHMLSSWSQHIIFGEIDFNETQTNNMLTFSGFDPGRPCCFIWEGVIKYLPKQAVDTALEGK